MEATRARHRPRPRGGIWTLFSVHGVPVRVHWTLLLALPYLALAFVAQLGHRTAGAVPPGEIIFLGFLLAVALFIGVGLHELAHTLVGIRFGGVVRSITLMFLGGVSELAKPPTSTRAEMGMALAGPLASLALAASSWAVARGVGRVVGAGLLTNTFGLFASVNLTIAIFNLMPAFPLDGGRILRGALVRPLGPARATRTAAAVGKSVAALLGIGGLMGGNPFLVMIALFIYFGAAAESEMSHLEARLADVRVGDLVDRAVALIDAGATIEEAAARMAETHHRVLLAVRDGFPVGQIGAPEVRAAPTAERSRVTVATAMRPTEQVLGPDDRAADALQSMRESGLDRLPVVKDGQLLGVIRREDVLRLVELRDLPPR